MTPFKWMLATSLALGGAASGAPPARTEIPAPSDARVVANRFLDNLVGDWQISRKIRGEVVGNTLQATWELNHQFVQLHMRDVKEPSQYEALVLIGYEEKNDRYVAYWCDSFGPDFAAVGVGKRQATSLSFTFNYPSGPFHNTFTWDPATSTWKFLLESEKQDGTRVLFAEDTVRKK